MQEILDYKDVMILMDCSKNKAYKIIQEIKKTSKCELPQKGMVFYFNFVDCFKNNI